MRKLIRIVGLSLFLAALLTVRTGTAQADPPTPGAIRAANLKVMTIVIENHSYSQMLADMPYLALMSGYFLYFDNYYAITHPSEPNYIDMIAGDNLGDTSDHSSSQNLSGQSVFGQAFAAGEVGATYAEDMVGNCRQTDGTVLAPGSSTQKLYTVKHNPWIHMADERTLCNAYNVPMGSPTSGNLHNSIVNGTLPNVGMMVPNQCNDAHQSSGVGCGLPRADDWLGDWIPALMGGWDYQAGRLAIVITADEDDGGSSNKVLTTVIEPSQQGKGQVHAANGNLNHYSLAGLYSDVTGSTHLRGAVGAPSFAAAAGWK